MARQRERSRRLRLREIIKKKERNKRKETTEIKPNRRTSKVWRVHCTVKQIVTSPWVSILILGLTIAYVLVPCQCPCFTPPCSFRLTYPRNTSVLQIPPFFTSPHAIVFFLLLLPSAFKWSDLIWGRDNCGSLQRVHVQSLTSLHVGGKQEMLWRACTPYSIW